MLSNTWMGAVALFILWGNTLLVLLAALRNLGSLRALVADTRPLDVASLPVGTHRGWFRASASAPVATHVIHQLGRLAAGGAPAIIWHDQRAESTSLEAELTVGQRAIAVPARREHVAVWADEGTVRARAACPSPAEFDLAAAGARKPKGFERPVEVALSGDVHVVGTVRVGPEAALVVDAENPLVLSAFDPVAFVRRRTLVVVFLFIPITIGLAGVCTALALTPPVFESWVSKLGGMLGLLFFLLVLPAGTRLRDFLLPPHRQFLRGAWSDPRKA